MRDRALPADGYSRAEAVLLIQACNIHCGGGAALLRPLLQVPFAQPRRAWVDQRFALPAGLADGVQVSGVPPTVTARLRAHAEVALQAARDDILLCLGNLPPLRRPTCRTVVYLQNRYLVAPEQPQALSPALHARLALERLWLRALASRANLFLVQTPSMRQAVCEHLGLHEDWVRVAPYVPGKACWPRSIADPHPARPAPGNAQDDRPFLYVASGERHKNHATLIQSWKLLASEGHYPRLQLTLDPARYPQLVKWIRAQSSCDALRIEINAAQGVASIDELYRGARALIYPSCFESFGLPLVEARQAGLPVLAPEEDYVRDVLEPEEVFNVNSARSIARAVKRFLGLPEPCLPALDAGQFLHMLWEECRR